MDKLRCYVEDLLNTIDLIPWNLLCTVGKLVSIRIERYITIYHTTIFDMTHDQLLLIYFLRTVM